MRLTGFQFFVGLLLLVVEDCKRYDGRHHRYVRALANEFQSFYSCEYGLSGVTNGGSFTAPLSYFWHT